MLKSFFGSRKGSDVPAADQTAAVIGGPAAGVATRPAAAFAPSWVPPVRAAVEVPLPSVAELAESWRQDVARVCLDLRERHPITERDHSERLLVKVAVDLEFSVRQPSKTAQDAFAASTDPSCDVPTLVRLVNGDATLSKALVRTSGSALYAGAGGAPTSVEDAVRRLGAKGVQVAVLAGMAETLLARPAGSFGSWAHQIWLHMTRVGPMGRVLARAFDVPAHDAFVAALLHDVGKLVVCDLVGALRDELRRDVLLHDALGLDALVSLHEPLGGLALLRWGVDPRIACAVVHHHRADQADPGGRLSECVFLAERLDLARARGRELAVERWMEEGRMTADPDRIASCVEKVLEEAAATSSP